MASFETRKTLPTCPVLVVVRPLKQKKYHVKVQKCDNLWQPPNKMTEFCHFSPNLFSLLVVLSLRSVRAGLIKSLVVNLKAFGSRSQNIANKGFVVRTSRQSITWICSECSKWKTGQKAVHLVYNYHKSTKYLFFYTLESFEPHYSFLEMLVSDAFSHAKRTPKTASDVTES